MEDKKWYCVAAQIATELAESDVSVSVLAADEDEADLIFRESVPDWVYVVWTVAEYAGEHADYVFTFGEDGEFEPGKYTQLELFENSSAFDDNGGYDPSSHISIVPVQ